MSSSPARIAPIAAAPVQLPRRGQPARLQTLARRKPLGAISAVILLLFVFVALATPAIAPYSPIEANAADALQPPGLRHLMGTDQFGRDVLSRLMFGARTSLVIGIVTVILSSVLGLFFGTLSGYFGGKVDMVIQRVVDVLFAFPSLLLLLALVAVVGPSLPTLTGALAFVGWPAFSRVVRGTVLSAKENQYVEAARALGAGGTRIILRHILPNVFAPVIILATAGLGGVIVAESSLSFLGLGVPPPTPTWGGMLSGASTQFLERAPWVALFTGMTLSLVVFSFNLLGDALRDVLDPRLRTG